MLCVFNAASGCVRLHNPDGTEHFSDIFNIAHGVLQGDLFSAIAVIIDLLLILMLRDLPDVGVIVGTPPYHVMSTRVHRR